MPWADTARIVDVSHWQPFQSLDWEVAQGVGVCAALVKYSQGNSGVDPAAAGHIARSYDAGIPLHGGYHFGDGSPGEAQAKHFLDLCHQHWQGDLGGLMLMLDAERNSNSQMSVEIAEAFVATIHSYVGRWPWVYMGRDGPTGDGAGLPSAILANCPLVLPKYGPTPDQSNLPAGFRFPADASETAGVLRGWQFTDGGINGGPIAGMGRVDQSRFIGVSSLDEARAIWAV